MAKQKLSTVTTKKTQQQQPQANNNTNKKPVSSGMKAPNPLSEANSGSTASTSSSSSSLSNINSPIMRAVRAVRTFEPRVFLHKHVFGIYWGCIGTAFVFANWKQHQRMKKLYPDYNEVAKSTGSQFTSMKEQELSDVRSFNAKAEMMRVDLKQRMGGSAI